MIPQLEMMPAGTLQGRDHTFDGVFVFLFFIDAGDEVDIIVFADSNQDREEKHGDFPVQSDEILWIERPEDGKGDSQCDQITEKDTQNQISANGRTSEQDDQNQKHTPEYQDINPGLIMIGDCLQVADAGCGSDIKQLCFLSHIFW